MIAVGISLVFMLLNVYVPSPVSTNTIGGVVPNIYSLNWKYGALYPDGETDNGDNDDSDGGKQDFMTSVFCSKLDQLNRNGDSNYPRRCLVSKRKSDFFYFVNPGHELPFGFSYPRKGRRPKIHLKYPLRVNPLPTIL